MGRKSDIQVLKKILYYCFEINDTNKRYGNTLDILENDHDYYRSISMSLFQIGEISKHLSQEYRDETKDKFTWSSLKELRNIFAHEYDEMNVADVWNSMIKTIPKLCEFVTEELLSLK